MKIIDNIIIPQAARPTEMSHWYVLRTTYGRENKARDYLAARGVETYYPIIKVVKLIDGKRKIVTKSRFPNLFFAHGSEDLLKSFVYDNVNLPYLRFYYRHAHEGANVKKIPVIVPDYQMEDLKIICSSDLDNATVTSEEIKKFKTGMLVKVIDGKFKGFVGYVTRWRGQQRVGVIIDGIATVVTAYIPSAFLRPMNE